jgi:hypothetical protein
VAQNLARSTAMPAHQMLWLRNLEALAARGRDQWVIDVYCSRGDTGCESIFQRLASGGSEKGTEIVKYPRWNDVCEADQAFLNGWSGN